MNGNTALDLIMARLVRTDTALRTSALAEMNNLIHTKLEQGPLVPWFLIQDDLTTMITVADDESVALPTGFIRFDDDMELGGIWRDDTSLTGPDKWVRLDRSGYNKMLNFYGDDETDTPVVYDIVDDSAKFRPIPDAAYQLRIMGYFADTDVTDAGTTTRWLTKAPDLVLAETTELLARVYLQDYALATALQKDVQEARQRLLVANTAFIESMKSRMMGDD